VLDDEDQLSIIREIYKQGEINQKDIKPTKMVMIIDKLKMNNINLNSINTIQQLKALEVYKFEDLKIIKYIYKEYKNKLIATNLLDFNDLLLLTHQLLKNNVTIRTKWQDKFHYILVDEFQDTNEIQFEILQFLISPKTHNVFAVGDPDQTIYTWRGAYANIFNDYLDSFKNTKTLVLDLNYRSTKEILKVSNNLISHNEERIEKQLVTNNEQGSTVVFFKGDTLYDEAGYVSRQIKQMVEKHEFDYSDIAILYRANYLSRHIEQELIHHSIPYYIYGGIKFYQRMEIKDLLAYLKLMTSPNDETALKRIINVPRRNIGLTTVEKIVEYARTQHISFADALKLNSNDLP
jgi:DNA helicase-2/ATP-dependent DNA helicase PcrA